MRSFLYLPLVVLALIVLSSACARPVPASDPAGVPLPAFEAPFRTAHPSWRGADASYSIPLSASRALWLFGDTWITAPDAKGREGGRLVRNTIGLQSLSPGPAADLEFHWSTDPESEAPLHAAAFLRDGPAENWLWPLDGAALEGGLCLFVSRIAESKGGLGFASAGNALAVIENPAAPPADWRPRYFEIPGFRKSKTGDRVWGLACARADETPGADVIIYGIAENWLRGMDGRSLLVARCPPAELIGGTMTAWRYWDGAAWSPEVEKASPLFAGAAAEMSVDYVPAIKRYAAVYTNLGMSDEIVLRTAPRPEGPWSEPKLIYRCPEPSANESYMTYAAKAHPELSAPGFDLVVTYAVNSKEFGDHFSDLDLYWPKFVGVKLDF